MEKNKSSEFPTDEKVTLKSVNVVQIVDDVVSSLNKLQEAFHDVKDHKYGPALAAILSVIQQLFVNEVMPHIGGLKGSEPGDEGEKDAPVDASFDEYKDEDGDSDDMDDMDDDKDGEPKAE